MLSIIGMIVAIAIGVALGMALSFGAFLWAMTDYRCKRFFMKYIQHITFDLIEIEE